MDNKRVAILEKLDEIRGYPYVNRDAPIPKLKKELRFMEWATKYR